MYLGLGFFVGDTRTFNFRHLRHSILDLTREVYKASQPPTFDGSEYSAPRGTSIKGSNSFLTLRILLTIHEPCIMCSIALLRSCVAKLVHSIPMDKSGGCGGLHLRAFPGWKA